MAKNLKDWEEERLEDNNTILDRLTRLSQNCSYCKPNRGENSSKQPRPDRQKNKNRNSIRKQVVEE